MSVHVARFRIMGKQKNVGCWSARALVVLAGLLVVPLAAPLAAADPVLEGVSPRGGRRGSEVTLTLRGQRLDDAVDLLFYEPGVALASLDVTPGKEVRAIVRIDAEAPLGEHALRLRTRTGLSELRTFFVGALQAVDEAEPNGDFLEAQKVPLGSTIQGVVQREDVDYFSFEAKKGQRVTAEVEAMRLGGEVFDPYLAILNAERFELASCDDSPLLGQDAVASVVIPEDGIYVLEVREASYGGGGGSLYRVHVGTFPRPLAVFPPGGPRGGELEVAFLGDVAGELRKKLPVPEDAGSVLGLFAEDEGGVAPSPNPFRVSPYGNVNEVEPNGRFEEATQGTLPSALNGILQTEGDVDFFRFDAKKDQVFDAQLYARRIGSPVDSVLDVLAADGKVVVSNDDSTGTDSYVRFKAPEDGSYAIRIRDHLGRGGPCNVYRVEVVPVERSAALSFPKPRPFSQERQVVCVPRGNRTAALVAVARSEFGGDVRLATGELPAGVASEAQLLAGNANEVPVLFEASPDAALDLCLFSLTASPAEGTPEFRSEFRQDVELVTGNPGQSVYWSYSASRPAIVITEEVPFHLRIVEPKAPLVRNGSMGLRVIVERDPGFEEGIRLELLFQPPGISGARRVDLPKGQTEASIPLNANARAPIQAWKIAVIGTANAGKGEVTVSSQLATVRVVDPPFTLALDRAAAEQAQEATVVFKVEGQSGFEGTAKLELVGLPPKVGAAPVEITKETTEGAFRLSTQGDSPPGRHKNIFCSVQFQESEETVVYGTGSTELRIDPPPPPKPDAPPKPVEVAAPKEPEKPENPEKPEKPLTRLEKLRLQAQQRIEEAAKESEE